MDLSLFSDDELFEEIHNRFDMGYVFAGERKGSELIDCDTLIIHLSSGHPIIAAGLIRAAQLH